jgi:hypothetical protein
VDDLAKVVGATEEVIEVLAIRVDAKFQQVYTCIQDFLGAPLIEQNGVREACNCADACFLCASDHLNVLGVQQRLAAAVETQNGAWMLRHLICDLPEKPKWKEATAIWIELTLPILA